MHRKRYIVNTVFLVLTSMVAQVIGLFVLPLFIKNLGEEMYGIFIISNLLMGYVGLFDFGFTDGIARQVGRAYAARDEKGLSESVSTGFWLLVGVGALAGGIVYFGRYPILDLLNVVGRERELAARLLTYTALFSLIEWPIRLQSTILKATLHIKQLSIIEAAQSIITALTMLTLVLISANVVEIRVGVCLVSIITWLPLVLMVRRYVPEIHWHLFTFHKRTFRTMSGFSLGMFYTRLLSMLSTRIDHLILGSMISVAAVAPYMVAAKLFEVIRSYTDKFFGALLPTVFSLDNDRDRHRLQTLLEEGVRYRAILIIPLACTAIIISPAFIRTWMGPEYAHYAIWSQLYILIHITNIFGVGTNVARGLGRLKKTNALLSVRVIVNIALSIALVPRFGVGGPILGTVISSVLLGDTFCFPFFCRMCRLDYRKALRVGIAVMMVNTAAAVPAMVLVQRLAISDWTSLIIVSASLTAAFYWMVYLFFVRQKEKQDIYMALEASGVTRLHLLDSILQRALL